MTLIDITSNATGRGRTLVLKCDICGHHFERKYLKSKTESDIHTCSITCRSKLTSRGGLRYEQRMSKLRDTSMKKYGVEYAITAPEVREKSRKTLFERYGVDNPSKSMTIVETRRQTFIERYGVDSPRKIAGITERIRQTCIEKYGVDNPMKSDEVFTYYYKKAHSTAAAAKRRATSLRNFGVEQPLSSHIVRKKARQTCIERYGDEYPMKTDEVKERRRQTYLKNLGVEHPSQLTEVRRRAHETMKRNGTYAKSSSTVEDHFYDVLVSIFGKERVERHVEVNGWCIDFYVTPFSLYIQFDGVYWHGLDRSIEVIKEFRNPRDITIYNTWLRDREQEKWFEANGIPLLRVTDKDDHEQMMFKLIREVGDIDGEEG